MTGKTTDNKHWTDPKDYGLPYVEVVPLAQTDAPKREEEVIAPIDVSEVKKRTIQSVKPSFAEEEKASKPEQKEQKIEAKKSNNSWIWIAAVLALAVVLVIIWQMNKSVVPNQDSEELVSGPIEGLAAEENDAVSLNSTPTEETQLSDNQPSISDSITSVSPVAESAQTGTTIASEVSGTLVRVEEKASRPYFYVVVGSLPNEAMAIEEAQKYMDRAETVYLILPYEDVTNYRLAIAGSIGFTEMTEELARVKDQYTEDLWILKY
ncbi:hypothetical protein SAMN04489724_4130 [Algoriphagus locisalis]|uniref:SPOR domain-containing protein n=1 Tax=Algoriphagus locisalis TaxID=305507 RepID=A0A1I7DLQ1_9BACT|nr:hypothetical protein [Algoriphagus locisalis]SFU12612.1 hypothetical protein SAMN04489724_4130 [Algoriphagus locisalis]